LAYAKSNGKPLTGVAPEALQQGVAVARNIRRQLYGKTPQPFSYFNKGRLAIIGGYSGVGKVGPFLLTGFLPWLMWLVVHLVYLPGFRNRLLVLLSWFHGYGLCDRAIRLILTEPSPDTPGISLHPTAPTG
ncbi:MAG: FAD-dependent oxidoreductase, partial [Cyanobacteria bacterium P01_A01_bin.15]